MNYPAASGGELDPTDFADYPSTIFRTYGASTDYSNHFRDYAKSVGFNSPPLAAGQFITAF